MSLTQEIGSQQASADVEPVNLIGQTFFAKRALSEIYVQNLAVVAKGRGVGQFEVSFLNSLC